MKNKIISMVLVLTLLLTATGCGIKDTVDKIITGEVTGEVGKEYSTQWFDFTIKSITPVDEYAGYAPEEGNMLYDVVITETSTFDEPNPFGTFDFVMDAESFSEEIYPMDPIEGQSTMMPKEYTLEEGDTVEYHMVYEVPKDTADLKLIYVEVDETDDTGVTFTININ